MNKKNKFLKKATKKLGNKYDYSNVNYKDSTTKINIICNKHGVSFWQKPSEHLRGKTGCELCKKKKTYTTESFIKESKKVHGKKYDYSKVEYKRIDKPVVIVCNEHGPFEQTPLHHMNGQGCPDCGKLKAGSKRTYDTETFIQKAKKEHGDKYDYSLVEYERSDKKVSIRCPEHDIVFKQTPAKHLQGKGCKKCSSEKRRERLVDNVDDFIKEMNKTHNNKYDYSEVKYINRHTKIKINCPDHGPFYQVPYDHLSGHGCTKCTSSISNPEIEINKFLNDNGVNTITSSTSIIPPYQLDIYIPDHNIGIEFNGLYWHNENRVDKDYHLNKTEKCNEKGIELTHIFEDEWIFKSDIIKSMLKNKLGLTHNKIYARNCKIRSIDHKTSKEFLEENHIQGSSNSSIRLGLFYNDNLVSLMTFNKSRSGIGSKHDGYELSRFCNKMDYVITGGASKLFNYFLIHYKPTLIVSYSDRRFSSGKLYRKLGFNIKTVNKPNYWYILNKRRKHRFNFRKNKLVDEGYDPNKSEHEIMLERGIYRIYDCGTIGWEWTY